MATYSPCGPAWQLLHAGTHNRRSLLLLLLLLLQCPHTANVASRC
jgi:hypothetical protein